MRTGLVLAFLLLSYYVTCDFVCAPYTAINTNNALQNYAVCSFTACGGSTLSINNCGCSGDTYVRLLDDNNNQLAGNDDGCGASLCSGLGYTVPGNSDTCRTYTLRQGCYNMDSCGGQFSIYGIAPPTCNQFDASKYGAPKPVITSSASGSTITISVAMLRQFAGNTGSMTVFHSLDTKEVGANVCRASDNLVSSLGSGWVRSTTSCTETYTLTQSLADIVNTASANNNWVAVLENNGQDIKYTVPIYSTFSVNSPGDGTCYYVGFKSFVSFRTQLNIASTSSSFTTADGSAKWQFSGLRTTSDAKLEITGQMVPLVPASELRAIALAKRTGPISIPTTTTTCTTYNVGCPQVYSVALSALPTDLTDYYDNTMEVWERDVTNTFVKTRDVTLSYQLSYIIPSDPTVVDSDTIQTSTKLYTDNTYTTIRTASYSSLASAANSLFIENAITATSPAIPSTYKLRMTRGYLCCVSYLGAISTYDPITNPTGGCASSNGKLEWVDLGSETVHPTPSVVLTSSDTLGNKKFRVEVPMSTANAANTAHAAPMTCQVLMISKLEAPAARRIASDPNPKVTYVATVPFIVESVMQVTASANAVGVSVFAAVIVLATMLL